MMKLRWFGFGKASFGRWMFCVLTLVVCLSSVAMAAGNITGVVRNQSNGQPAGGDDVVLIQLDGGMQEEARTKTDERGAFTFAVQHPDKTYLVRVMHQGVGYDQRASAGNHLSMEVFDAAPQVHGVTGSIEILRATNKGNSLHVSDMYEIRNESSPPLTLAGSRTFDVYLPADAKIDSVLAAGPGKMGEVISAEPVLHEPGHYRVNFPLKPGSTKFAFNYDLPYHGHAEFRTRREYPVQQLAVMVPLAMKFSSRSAAFQALANANPEYQVEAANQLKAGEGPAFEISGGGGASALREPAKTPVQVPPSPSSAPSPKLTKAAPDRAAFSLAFVDSQAAKKVQASSDLLILAGVGAFFVAACVLMIWRKRRKQKAGASGKTVLRGGQMAVRLPKRAL